MKLLRCEKGHFYDSEKYDLCPHCNNINTGLKIERCVNGHLFDSNKHHHCPYCEVGPGYDLRGNMMYAPESETGFMYEDSFRRNEHILCENGHSYDPERYYSCPICNKKESRLLHLEIVRCEAGHFYNALEYDVCPYCNAADLLTNCGNGHFYDQNEYYSCPYCNKKK